MKRSTIHLWMCAALAICGCYPERIVWSPDGQRALVATKERLYLCDPNGLLTPLGTGAYTCMAWLSDSNRFAAATMEKLATWNDLEPLLSKEDKDRIIPLAEDMREDILKAKQVALGKLESVQGKDENDVLAARMYLRDRRAADLAEKVGDAWKEFESAAREYGVIRMWEIAGAEVKPGPILAKSLSGVASIRIPSHEKAIAWSAPMSGKMDGSPANLFVVAADGTGIPRLVAGPCNWYFDWSPDGRSLVCAVPEGEDAGKGAMLLKIERREVCAADGTVLQKPGDAQTLAVGAFGGMTRIRCLQDGRILFSSTELQLPMDPNDAPAKGNLFAIDPSRQATVARLLPHSSQAEVPDALDFFSVSPDGARVCIPSDKGEAAVVDLATGEVHTIVGKPKDESSKQGLITVPVWRAGGELCLIVPAGHPLGSPNRPEVILWSGPGKVRLLSKDWPDEVIDGLVH